MQTTINLSGVRVHVGFFRQGSVWRVDEADCYIQQTSGHTIDGAAVVEFTQIDDIDTLGIMRNGVFHSVRTLAEDWIDGQSAAIELAGRQSVVEGRE